VSVLRYFDNILKVNKIFILLNFLFRRGHIDQNAIQVIIYFLDGPDFILNALALFVHQIASLVVDGANFIEILPLLLTPVPVVLGFILWRLSLGRYLVACIGTHFFQVVQF
jgi:hypothetical protein